MLTHKEVVRQIRRNLTGGWAVPCIKCGTVRTISSESKNKVVKKQTTGLCAKCSRAMGPEVNRLRSERNQNKEPNRVEVKCSKCGTAKLVGRKYAALLEKKGIGVLCLPCTNRSEQHYVGWTHPINGPLPLVCAGPSHRCHGLWEGCIRYNDCLTWAGETKMEGWVCGLPHDATYFEIIDRKTLLEGYEQAMRIGFIPESDCGLALPERSSRR